MITRLDAQSARKISAGQVITDVASVAKELLENALDAHATTVTMRLYNFGVDKIVVDDDGEGIAMGDVLMHGALRDDATTPLLSHRATTKLHLRDDTTAAVTRRGSARCHAALPCSCSGDGNGSGDNDNGDGAHTSSPTDDNNTDSNSGDGGDEEAAVQLGFRGEALHSLAQLSDVCVVTMHASSAPHSVEVRYDRERGASTLRVCDAADPAARRHTGTTVTVCRLFDGLPVRRKELVATARAQLVRVAQLLKQYAVSHPQLRLVVLHHERATAAPVHLVSLTGTGDLLRSVSDAYGGLCLTRMHHVEWRGVFGLARGLVSNAGDVNGRLRSDQQVFALDGRLVDLPRCAKAINDAYVHSLPPDTARRVYVAFFLQLHTPPSARYDVNLTPSKRKVLLAEEDAYVAELYRVALDEFAGTAGDGGGEAVMAVARQQTQHTSSATVLLTPPRVGAAAASTSSSARTAYVLRVDDATTATTTATALLQHDKDMHLDKLASFLYGDGDAHAAAVDADDEVSTTATSSSSSSSTMIVMDSNEDTDEDDGGEGAVSRKRSRDSAAREECDDDDDDKDARVLPETDASCRAREAGPQWRCSFPSWARLACDTSLLSVLQSSSSSSSSRTCGCDSGFASLQAQTDAELTLYFHKRSFAQLRVLGQFNHGFILAARERDVFVIDQHASDEKYNYERLMRSYVAQPQPLVMPASVTMDATEVDVAVAHAEVLRAHGFDVARGAEATTLRVRTIPMLPYDVVAASDVLELIQQLSLYARITRPLRAVWHSMATKACRSSIMIGTPLSLPVMRRVVRRLGAMLCAQLAASPPCADVHGDDAAAATTRTATTSAPVHVSGTVSSSSCCSDLRELNEAKVANILSYLQHAITGDGDGGGCLVVSNDMTMTTTLAHATNDVLSPHACDAVARTTPLTVSALQQQQQQQQQPSRESLHHQQQQHGVTPAAATTRTSWLSSGVERAQQTYLGIKHKMDALRFENAELQRDNEELRARLRTARDDADARVAEVQARVEHDAQVAQRQQLRRDKQLRGEVEALAREKAALQLRVDEVAAQLRAEAQRRDEELRKLESAHAAAVTTLKARWQASEKAAREKWRLAEAKRIKETTLQSLEPDIVLLLNRHKADKARLREEYENELRQRDELLARKEAALDEVKARLQREAAAALQREQAAYEESLREATTRVQRQLDEERQRAEAQRAQALAFYEHEKAALQRDVDALSSEVRELKRQRASEQAGFHAAVVEEARRVTAQSQETLQQLKDKLLSDLAAREQASAAQNAQHLRRLEQELRQRCDRERDAAVSLVVQRLEQEHAAALAAARNGDAPLRAHHAELLREKERLGVDVELLRGQLTAALDESRRLRDELARNAATSTLSQQHLRAAEERVRAQYEHKLSILDHEWHTKLSELETRHVQEVCAAQQRSDTLQRELQTLRAQHETELKTLEQRHHVELENINERVLVAVTQKDSALRAQAEQVLALQEAVRVREAELQRHGTLLA